MTDVKWLSDAEQALWRAWVQAHARLHGEIQHDLRDSSLSEPDFEVLVQLTDQPDGGLRLHELAARLHWERSRVSHQVTRMAKRGLLERRECADDGRGARVVVLEPGRAAIKAAAPGHVATVRRHFVDLLDDDDRRALARVLAKLEGVEDLRG